MRATSLRSTYSRSVRDSKPSKGGRHDLSRRVLLQPRMPRMSALTFGLVLLAASISLAAGDTRPRKLAQTIQPNSQYETPDPVQNPNTLPNGCVDEWVRVNDYVKDDCATANCPDRGPGPYYGCEAPGGGGRTWCMLPAYRSNNQKFEGLAWKYTDDPDDPECLHNWTYYDTDGSVIRENIPSITKEGDTKNWCAMATYVAKDDEVHWVAKSWNYCKA